MKVILTGILDSFRSLSDRSVKLTFTTQEIQPDEMKDIHAIRGEYSKIMLSTTNINDEQQSALDELKLDAEAGESKTPSPVPPHT